MLVKATDEQEEAYQDEMDQARADMQALGLAFASGEISEEEFERQMRDRIREYYIALALIASDGEFDDYEDLSTFINSTYGLLDDMIETVRGGEFSDRYVIWRAGIFAFGRGVFTRYNIPELLWNELPALPGIDCLGDGACGCSLEWETRADGTIAVYWLLGMTEHCPVCLDNAAFMNPYIIASPSAGEE